MEFQSYFLLIFMGFIMCCSLCEANYTFYAGGKSGWVLNPSEPYSHWAKRNRFQVNDTVVFKFKLGSDSVILVNKDDYNNCNKNNPILELKHGNSKFRFDGSGPFYFISGHDDNCEKGQKLMVIVMSPNHHKAQITLSPTPAQSVGPISPGQALVSPIPAQSIGPILPAQAPATSGAPGFIGGFSWSFIINLMMMMMMMMIATYVS